MANDIQYVERPERYKSVGRPGVGRGRISLEALLGTAVNGQALPVPGIRIERLHSYHAIKRAKTMGYRVNGRTVNGCVVVWCEKIEP